MSCGSAPAARKGSAPVAKFIKLEEAKTTEERKHDEKLQKARKKIELGLAALDANPHDIMLQYSVQKANEAWLRIEFSLPADCVFGYDIPTDL